MVLRIIVDIHFSWSLKNDDVSLYADNDPNRLTTGPWGRFHGGRIGTDFGVLGTGEASFTVNGSIMTFKFSTGAGFDNIPNGGESYFGVHALRFTLDDGDLGWWCCGGLGLNLWKKL